MPGFNQQGPMNEGPRTGRGMGPCATTATRPMSGRRFCGMGRGGGGAGRQMGRRGMFGNRFGGGLQDPLESDESLRYQIKNLEEELSALKRQLRDADVAGADNSVVQQ